MLFEFESLAHSGELPSVCGFIRAQPEDFVVEEILGFDLSGEGEHFCVWVEKTGQNTGWVAEQLAAFCGVSLRAVSYAGLKDRHSVSRQWFSVHLPGKADPPISEFLPSGVRAVKHIRHHRKLKIGCLQGNYFRIKVCSLNGDHGTLDTALHRATREGVPNYFGEQRFGFNGNNLEKAVAMFCGDLIPRRAKKSLYLSAARSWLFNAVLSERIRRQCWDNPLDGDVFMLNGSHSVFQSPDASASEIQNRLASGDIHITGPLFGSGQELVTGSAADFERQVLSDYPELTQGLTVAGLKLERRALRVIPQELEWDIKGDCLEVTFQLPAGCYATAVLRELVSYEDISEKAR